MTLQDRNSDLSQHIATQTSNDLLSRLRLQGPTERLNYEIVVQDINEVQDTQNAPSVSLGQYLIDAGLVSLLRTISIYSQRGESREQARLLYMNSAAFSVWQAMGRLPRRIGSLHRPPRTALLAFGVPFSE